MRHLALGSLLVFGLFVRPAFAQVSVEGLRVGFGSSVGGNEGSYKIGSWAPALVTVSGKSGSTGRVEISTADSDDVQTTFDRPFQIGPSGLDGKVEVPIYVKPGKVQPSFHVRLRDAAGRAIASESFESSSGHVAAGSPQRVTLIVTLGRPAGLEIDEIAKRPGYLRDEFRIAHAKSRFELPDRWFGYEAVDHLVVCAADAADLSLDPNACAAIESWVRQGGHLVLSLGDEWATATRLFGQMMPAEIDRTETVRQLNDLENYVGQNAPAIRLASPLSVPHLNAERGRILAGARDTPLVVRGPFGLGTVTLVALDVRDDPSHAEPFRSWEGRTDFWIKLLRLPKQRANDRTAQGAWSQRAASDLSSHLHVDLERFSGVSLVPFHAVAGLVFLYVLVVGPVDYWLVKRLKHMEWTWITFPVSVAGACLVACFANNRLKGDSLAVNKVDVIDVDAATGTLRGTSWVTLYSPTMKNYTVSVRPNSRWTSASADWRATPPATVSWLGVSEDAIGGIGRKGGFGLFAPPGYQFGPDAADLRGVPVAVCSTKGFVARWLGPAAETLDAKLQSIGVDRVRGSITNRTGEHLEDCVLAFGSRVYRLGNLGIRGSVLAESAATTEDLRGHLARRAEEYQRQRSEEAAGAAPDGRETLSSYDLVMTMMFRGRMSDENQIPPNDYFDEIDLSEQLDHQRAIFVGRLAAPGSQVLLDGVAATHNVESTTVIRVVLPVTIAPPAPEERRDPRGF